MAEGLHLIVQYFAPADPARGKELDFCLRRNLSNPHVAFVHNLVEAGVGVPGEFRAHPKYRERSVGRWLTYEAAFGYANEVIGPGKTCCLCNLDIFLDHETDWSAAAALVGGEERVVLCLSRHEFDGKGRAGFDEGLLRAGLATSQDAWVFRTPIDVADCDFELGVPGCDNAVAHRLKNSGYLPLNAPVKFKVIHYDLCRRDGGPAGRWQDRPSPRPEARGQFLLPAMEQVASLDRLVEQLNVPPLQRYEIACEIVSRFVKVRPLGEKDGK